MINEKALQYAAILIECSMDTLDDMPTELANTIANIYYKCVLQGIEAEEFVFPFMNYIGRDARKKGHNYAEYRATLEASFEAAPKVVENLRRLRKGDPNSYSDIVKFYLDILKYNINNAANKSETVRMMERKFKKVDEIEGLINLMKF